ncbi:hypothetical protein [Xylanivirga thermophila]|uniref:hypothetical protein n=1 Tax=Xylanivirga thermophila TaxID=2496273 RepID=UPI00101CFC27|nr:hypothetical protein [Xylanivirga thermophila]
MTEFGFRLEDIDLGLTLGREYEILEKNKNNGDKKICFRGIFEKEYEYFYMFRCNKNYCECFLKVDFGIGRYLIREVEDNFYFSITQGKRKNNG